MKKLPLRFMVLATLLLQFMVGLGGILYCTLRGHLHYREVALIAMIQLAVMLLSYLVLSMGFSRLVDISTHLARLAEGKLEWESQKSIILEVEKVFSFFEKAVVHIREIIGNFYTVSEQVSLASEELAANSGEVNNSGKDIAKAMETIATGAEEQSTAIQEVLAKAEELHTSARNIKEKVIESDLHLEKLTGGIAGLKELVGDLVASIEETAVLLKDSIFKFKQLQKEAQNIEDIVDNVQDIAEQTNLLALNAAIEAAKAGEQGKSFAVVAEEVKELAETSSRTVQRIKSTTKAIRDEIMAIAENMDRNIEQSAVNIKEAKTTQDSLVENTEKLDKVVLAVRTIKKLTELQEEAVRDVQVRSQEVVSVAQTNAAAIEEVAASTQQQMVALKLVNKNSEKLKKMSSDMHRYVEKTGGLRELTDREKAYVEKAANQLRNLIFTNSLIGEATGDTDRILKKTIHNFPGFEALIVTDLDGNILSSSSAIAKSANFSYRRWFREAATGKEYFSRVYISALSGKPIVTIALPLYDNSQKVKGVLSGGLVISSLQTKPELT